MTGGKKWDKVKNRNLKNQEERKEN